MIQLKNDFTRFMFSSNMAKASAAFAIGAATADLSKAITFSLLIPCVQIVWATATARTTSTALGRLDVSLVVENLLYWFCVIFVAYLLAEVFFSQGLLGIKTTLDDQEEHRLKVARAHAQNDVHELTQALSTKTPYAPAPVPAGSFAFVDPKI